MNGLQLFKAFRITSKINLKRILQDLDLSKMNAIQDDTNVAFEIGMQVLTSMLPELHLVEKEFFEFLADIGDCSIDEAKKMELGDIVNTLKNCFKGIDIGSFLKQSVNSRKTSN